MRPLLLFPPISSGIRVGWFMSPKKFFTEEAGRIKAVDLPLR
jgi:hypothetical protein